MQIDWAFLREFLTNLIEFNNSLKLANGTCKWLTAEQNDERQKLNPKNEETFQEKKKLLIYEKLALFDFWSGR